MIQSLYELGCALNINEDHQHYFASYANPFPKPGKGDDIVILLKIEKDKVTGYKTEHFATRDYGRYLYRKPKGARGAPLVPTGPYYPVHSLETEAQQKKQRDNLDKVISRIERAIPEGKSMFFSGDEARQQGLAAIDEILYNFKGGKNDRFLYTITIDDKYLGQIDALRNLLDAEAYLKYYEKSSAEGKTCSLSHKTNVEVWGRVDTLGFTVNDLSFSRGGFNAKDSYRMFPVSKPAALALEAARRFAFTNFTDRFYTLEYLVVPRMIMGTPEQLEPMADSLTRTKRDNTLTTLANPIIRNNSYLDILAAYEDFQKEGFLYDVLFYQKNQAQLALQLHLQDLPPTRFKDIADAVARTNELYGRPFGYTDKKTKEQIPFKISLGIVKDFFSEGTGLKVRFAPVFLRLLEAMFYGQIFGRANTVTALIAYVRKSFKNDGDDYHTSFRTAVFRAIATYTWFHELGILSTQNTTMSDNTIPPTETNDYQKELREGFLQSYDHFFGGQPNLKGAFLLGVATSMLLYEQYKRFDGNKPFLNKLGNLSYSTGQLRKLYADLTAKLTEYSRMRGDTRRDTRIRKGLETATEGGRFILESQSRRASRDDLSFAFAMGLNMQDLFARDANKRYEAEKKAKDKSPREKNSDS